MPKLDTLDDLRIGDLTTFLAVRRCGSITGAARELKVTPSQVSKAIARLEEHLRLNLLSRSSRGVALSEEGRQIAPQLEQTVTRLRMLRRADEALQPELTIAAPSYLETIFLPRIAAAHRAMRVRGLELPPALLRAWAAENFFDMTLAGKLDRLPGAWVSVHVGTLHKELFGTRALARRLGAQPVATDLLRDIPFIGPIYAVNGQFVPVDDDCPFGYADRKLGHQAQTIGTALELAAASDQLVFGPRIAARTQLRSGALVEIRVEGWDVQEPLYLACNGDRVMRRVQQSVEATLRAAIDDLDPPRR